MDRSTFTRFQARYPGYSDTSILDTIRETDFASLDATSSVYLDYTGGGLYSASQVTAHTDMLHREVLGNPHSDNPTSLRATQLADEARQAVLRFFNASSAEYSVIFTPNATGALRLVGEAYPFAAGGRFLQLADNHNSVNGIREFARGQDAAIRFIKSRRTDLRVPTQEVQDALSDHTGKPRLFAFPAQSNFSGVQHPLEWIAMAQAKGWDVLCDAAAFVPTNPLDLHAVKPEFVALSFYKMFGWPTGVGCLIAKKTALATLRRPWFSGGTIWALSVQADWHSMAPDHEAFEDGTINYLNLPAVSIGLDYLSRVGLPVIHTRVMCLTGWLLERLQSLTHTNGSPLMALYGPSDTTARGGTITCNFLTPEGRIVDERIVSREAKKSGISLRTGCFCNPGTGEVVFDLPVEKLAAARGDGHRQNFDYYLKTLGLQSGGAVRISLGIASNFQDVSAFLNFARQFQDVRFDTRNLIERAHC